MAETLDIVTWNVNSLRARLDGVCAWVKKHQPDVLCLQETKCADPQFPKRELEELGYHVAFAGQPNGLNGVAMLAREPLEHVLLELPGNADDEHRRLVAAKVGGVFVIGVYVPNGKSVGSDDFFYKLDWLSRLQAYLVDQRSPTEPLVLMGDFNIAPDDRDVPEGWEGGLHCTVHERRSLGYLEGWGLQDAQRIISDDPALYTWFDYRHTFKEFRSDTGMRIDLAYVTKPMAERLVAVEIDLAERASSASEKPSDHAPVTVRFRG
jgi:exodeoxyribonuclease-3